MAAEERGSKILLSIGVGAERAAQQAAFSSGVKGPEHESRAPQKLRHKAQAGIRAKLCCVQGLERRVADPLQGSNRLSRYQTSD